MVSSLFTPSENSSLRPVGSPLAPDAHVKMTKVVTVNNGNAWLHPVRTVSALQRGSSDIGSNTGATSFGVARYESVLIFARSNALPTQRPRFQGAQ